MDFHETSCKEGLKNNPLAQSWLNGQIQELLISVCNVAVREIPQNNGWIWNKKNTEVHSEGWYLWVCLCGLSVDKIVLFK